MTKWCCRMLIVPVCLLTAGCYEQRVVSDSWSGLRELSSQQQPRERPDPGDRSDLAQLMNQTAAPRHTVLLATMEGDDHARRAERLARRLERELNLPDVWTRPEGTTTQVVRGRFQEPGDPGLDVVLRQTRLLQLDGVRPFEGAAVLSLDRKVAPDRQVMDLKQYAGRDLYSLQIAVYDDAFGANFRDAAEEAATALRKDGEPAFFYHGPNRSMVTLGVFAYDEAWIRRLGEPDRYSEQVRALLEKYPYNLLNGRTIIEREDGTVIGNQASFLVLVR